MEFLFEILFEIIFEGIIAGLYYIFNKFFKNKVSDKSAKIISITLTTILFIGAFTILIFIAYKISK